MVRTGVVDILLVGDDPGDVELTLRVLPAQDLADRRVVVNDGTQALEYLSPQEQISIGDPIPCPRVILLDLKPLKPDGLMAWTYSDDSMQTRRPG